MPNRSPLLILASASPARRQLLKSAGIEPIVCPSDLDESQVQLTDAKALVETLAKLKGERIVTQIRGGELPNPAASDRTNDDACESLLVLACDSVLELKGEILGKPASPKDAIDRWQQMSGSFGDLYTGHALIDIARNRTLVKCQVTRVYFAQVSDVQIQSYVATGEPLKCAGCFAIDGKGGLFVEKLEGCHTNVIGLSLPLLRQMLLDFGYEPTDFWKAH
jgi:septum formation protein